MGRDLRVAAFPGSPSEAAAAFRGLQGLASTHLSVSSDPSARWSCALLSALDDLPLMGPLDGLPVVVLLGLGTLGHSWALVAARWIAEGLTGAQGVPPLFRVPRPPLRGRLGSREGSS
jgi:glycine/D-amino acid oxidase-like deaminating enzyme